MWHRPGRGLPDCGAANESGDRFCGTCGAALEPGAASPGAVTASAVATGEPDALGTTERRLVSVLFADLVGFTTAAESVDPETVQALQRGYFAQARAVIERYGGTVEKFIGDAVMAVWGTPVAREDDPERAVRAALDLVDVDQRIDHAGWSARARGASRGHDR